MTGGATVVDWTQVLVAAAISLPSTIAALAAATISLFNMQKNWQNAAAIEKVHEIVNSTDSTLRAQNSELQGQIDHLKDKLGIANIREAEQRGFDKKEQP